MKLIFIELIVSDWTFREFFTMDNLGYEDSDAEYNYDSDNAQSSNERIHDIEQLVLNPYRYGFFLCVIYELLYNQHL